MDLISREAALDCFHDWIDRHGDVHTPDEMAEYQAIEELPSVEPENRTEERTETHACDLISRQAAIDALHMHLMYRMGTDSNKKRLDEWINNLPSAQPERKRGFWWAIEKGEKGYSAGNFRCSVCGKPNASYTPKPNFCPNCGADMSA